MVPVAALQFFKPSATDQLTMLRMVPVAALQFLLL
jgi:hypothetical protein